MRKKEMKKRLKAIFPIFLILLLCVAAEMLFANFDFIAYGGNAEITDYVFDATPADIAEGETQILISGKDFEINSISLTTKTNYSPESVKVSLYQNSGVGDSYIKVFSREMTVGGTEVLRFDLGKEGDDLLLSFDGFDNEFEVSELIINPSYSVRFDFVRFFLIFAAAIALYLMHVNETGKRLRAKTTVNAARVIAVCVCVAGCGIFTFLGATGESSPTLDYPDDGALRYANPYVQQLDAFRKGQLNIDVEPSEELLELENPYDPAQRDGVNYLWDRAFYNGKYYSYFGVTPIFTVYYPFWLVSGKLPNDTTVKAVFALISAIFLPLAVFEISRLVKKKISPAMTAVAAIGAMFSSFVIFMQRGQAQFYYIAVLSAIAFLSLFVFLSVRALLTQKHSSRILLLAGAGIAFGLGFHSRVNTMLPAAAAAVAMLIIYFVRSVKNGRLGKLFACAAALGIPVAAAIVLSFVYNYARFGSIFEFGTSYQLTVLETSRYSLNFSGIIPCIFYYFFNPLLLTDEFPFIKTQSFSISGYNRQLYIDQNFGLFTMPFTLLMLVGIYMLFSKSKAPAKRIMLGVGTVSVLLTAFADFCLGGVVFRYVADIAPSAALISAYVLLELLATAQEDGSVLLQRSVKYGGTVLCALTVVVTTALALNTGGNFFPYDEEIYSALRSFF